MITKLNKTAIISVSIAVLSLAVGLGVNMVFAAWTTPSESPPGGDIAAPINVSGADQGKIGGLRLGSSNLPPAPYMLYVDGDVFVEGSIVPGSAGSYTIGNETVGSWDELWLNSDADGGILENGIHFADPSVGIRYDTANNRFDFYKDSVVLSIGDNGDLNTVGGITAAGGMNIDSNTLVVNNANNRVGVGTASPTYALDIDSGDMSIANGRLVIGSPTFPDADSTLYVGTSANPVSTVRAIAAYTDKDTPEGAVSTIYGNNMGNNWKAAVEGESHFGYGILGITESGGRAGVIGFNYGYRRQGEAGEPVGTDFAAATKGRSCVDSSCDGFGSGWYGSTTAARPIRATGVFGEGSHTDLSQGYIYTYGVYAMAGRASAGSSSEHIYTYGLYATEGAETNGGVSYAGYFAGDVHVEGNLTTDAGSSVGIGTTELTDALRVGGNLRVDSEDTDPAYLQMDTRSGAPVIADCDAADEIGRMVFDTNSNLLYVCDDSGWLSATLN
ncbi:hypothetical protein KJ705_00505 [Patescibacteria group bacterium]|nr:hypothetical protein [Patescibacteria group bacterium]